MGYFIIGFSCSIILSFSLNFHREIIFYQNTLGMSSTNSQTEEREARFRIIDKISQYMCLNMVDPYQGPQAKNTDEKILKNDLENWNSNDLEKQLLTKGGPSNPGPWVNQIPSNAALWMAASSSVAVTTGIIFVSWALAASSGTTPPYFLWMHCVMTTLLTILSPWITEAAVSSQDDSIPRMINGWFILTDKSSCTLFDQTKSVQEVKPYGKSCCKYALKMENQVPPYAPAPADFLPILKVIVSIMDDFILNIRI